jgi:ureidoacrylate peracid hydrolase
MHVATSALVLGDLQNDFLHRDGAYGRAGQTSPAIAALPDRLAPLVHAARQRGLLIAATLSTLVPGRSGEPVHGEFVNPGRNASVHAAKRSEKRR